MIGTGRGTVGGTVGGGGCTSNCENTCVLIPFPHQCSYLLSHHYESQSPCPSPSPSPSPTYIHSKVKPRCWLYSTLIQTFVSHSVTHTYAQKLLHGRKYGPQSWVFLERKMLTWKEAWFFCLQKCDCTVLILWRRRFVTCYEQCLHYFPLQNRIRRKIWIPLHYRLNRRSGLLLTKCVLLLQPLRWRTR